MLHNPYLKASKRPRTVENAAAVQNPYAATSIPRIGTSVPSNAVAPSIQISTASSSNQPRLLDNNDSFDAGIDWDAAIALVDQQENRKDTTAAGPPCEPSPNNPSVQTTSTTPSTDVPSLQNQQLELKQQQQPPPTCMPQALPQHPLSNRAIQQQQHAVASLRPTLWTNTKTNPTEPVKQHSPSVKQHSYYSNLPHALAQYKHPIKPPLDDSHRPLLIQNATLSTPLDNGWTLFPHQKRAILRGLVMRRMILALDMGLGKTLTACVWARAFQRTLEHLKIIVICPVSLKAEWKRTAEESTSLTVQEKEPCDWTTTDVCIASWAKIPTTTSNNMPRYVVIADEAHSMQSIQASRTRDALKLMLSNNCVGVLLLTGTPMKNGKPANLFPLLKAVRHPFGNHQREYETHFCAGHNKHFGPKMVWNASGASNLVQLRELVASHVLHITKDAVMKDLPPKHRTIHTVPVSAKCQIQHSQALRELARVYNSANATDNSESILGAVQTVRLVGSFAKVDATVQLAQQTLQNEPAIVIFTSFVQVAKLVHQRLKESGWEGQLLTGETPPKKRQGMVDDFQNGLSPVFVVTFGAGGVGLTLTAAHTVILLDRPWTPGDALQAEDRVRRIGQTKPVTSIWVSAFDLDKQIDSMLEAKHNTSNVVLAHGEENSDNSTEAPRISIFQMLRSILPGATNTGAESDGMRQASILEFSQRPSESNS